QVLSAMERGKEPGRVRCELKRRMYDEIRHRVMARRQGREDEPLINLVREVVYGPAPEHYVSPISAMNMYYSYVRNLHKNGNYGKERV
ncbi:MAG: hypothetical protein NC102_05650, partial [Clostridium sp.]|nr:hypothetical protein [Clostridium sp.]